MFDEPTEEPTEKALGPSERAREKADELRMHAELAAVFEGNRKFAANIMPGFDDELAREVQRGMARLEKSKSPDSPVLPPASGSDAEVLLKVPQAREISTNDYHIYRRPGETMIIRWLAAEQVDSFYERLQAHFDAALGAYRDEERQAQAWKQDRQTLAYLEALDRLEVRMADRYLRDIIRKHRVFVQSTQTIDEINVAYLCDYVIGVPAAEIVGPASAPPDAPTEQDLAWFFKLFSLRGIVEDVERMCFFTYMQKSDESY